MTLFGGEVISTKTACEILGCSDTKVCDLAKSGLLKKSRIVTNKDGGVGPGGRVWTHDLNEVKDMRQGGVPIIHRSERHAVTKFRKPKAEAYVASTNPAISRLLALGLSHNDIAKLATERLMQRAGL